MPWWQRRSSSAAWAWHSKDVCDVTTWSDLALPHHSVGSLSDVGQIAVARPDVEGLPADQLSTGAGVGAQASSGRYRSCRHYENGLYTLTNKKCKTVYNVCMYIYSSLFPPLPAPWKKRQRKASGLHYERIGYKCSWLFHKCALSSP